MLLSQGIQLGFDLSECEIDGVSRVEPVDVFEEVAVKAKEPSNLPVREA